MLSVARSTRQKPASELVDTLRPGWWRVPGKRLWNGLSLTASVLLAMLSTTVWCDEAPGQRMVRVGNGNIAAGQQKSDSERCQECHGINGISGDLRIPNHAGQFADYLIKQLADFQSGARQHEVMNVMAADLTAEDRADISAYFASQTPPPAGPVVGNDSGQNLYANGDPARNLPACAKCHGEQAQGAKSEQSVYPRLAGQRKVYLRSQLVNWRLGDRRNSPDGVMNDVAKALSDDDIDALVAYLSAL